MVQGSDFDQVWAGALRSSSARTLFAYAARHGCHVHSLDWVAAYLQGELLPGEVVYVICLPAMRSMMRTAVL